MRSVARGRSARVLGGRNTYLRLQSETRRARHHYTVEDHIDFVWRRSQLAVPVTSAPTRDAGPFSELYRGNPKMFLRPPGLLRRRFAFRFPFTFSKLKLLLMNTRPRYWLIAGPRQKALDILLFVSLVPVTNLPQSPALVSVILAIIFRTN